MLTCWIKGPGSGLRVPGQTSFHLTAIVDCSQIILHLQVLEQDVSNWTGTRGTSAVLTGIHGGIRAKRGIIWAKTSEIKLWNHVTASSSAQEPNQNPMERHQPRMDLDSPAALTSLRHGCERRDWFRKELWEIALHSYLLGHVVNDVAFRDYWKNLYQ